MGKWQLIEEVLKKYGYNDLAEKAREIKELLIKIYGDENTKYWERYGVKWSSFLLSEPKSVVKLATMMELVSSQYPCKACEVTMEETGKPIGTYMEFCGACRFAKEAGICWNKNSLWYNFWHELIDIKEVKGVERFFMEEIEDMGYFEEYKGWVIIEDYGMGVYIAIKGNVKMRAREYNIIRRKIDGGD